MIHVVHRIAGIIWTAWRGLRRTQQRIVFAKAERRRHRALKEITASFSESRPDPPLDPFAALEYAREQYARYLLERVGVTAIGKEIVNVARSSGPAEATGRVCQSIGYSYAELCANLPFLLTRSRDSATVRDRALAAQVTVDLDPAAAQGVSALKCPANTEYFGKKIDAAESALFGMAELGSALQAHLRAAKWRRILTKSWADIPLTSIADLRKHILHLRAWQDIGDAVIENTNRLLALPPDGAAGEEETSNLDRDGAEFIAQWTGSASERSVWPRVRPTAQAMERLLRLAEPGGPEARRLAVEAAYFRERSFRTVRPVVPWWW